MNFLLKPLNLSRLRFSCINFRNFSKTFERISNYKEVCTLNNEINNIFSKEPIAMESIYNLFDIFIQSSMHNVNTILSAFSKIDIEIKKRSLDVSSEYYLYLARFLVEIEYDFDPTMLLKIINDKGIAVNQKLFHHILLRYSRMGDVESAKLIHNKVLSRYGTNVYHYVFVYCAAIRAKNKAVMEEYKSAIEKVDCDLPRFMIAHIFDAYASIFDFDKCIELFHEMQAKDPLLESPYKEIYNMYYVAVMNGASEEVLLKAIEFINNYPDVKRFSIVISMLFQANKFREAITFSENINMQIIPAKWKVWLRMLLRHHNPPQDIYEFYFKKTRDKDYDIELTAELLSFEDALKAVENYFLGDHKLKNAYIISALILNASNSEESLLKLKTVLRFCRKIFSRLDFNGFLIVNWINDIRKLNGITYSTMISDFTDDMTAFEKQMFILCCVVNALCRNSLEEAKELIADFHITPNNKFLFEFLHVTNYLFANFQDLNHMKPCLLLIDSVLYSDCSNKFFHNVLLNSCKRQSSENVLSLVEFLEANTHFVLTMETINFFHKMNIRSSNTNILKEFLNKKHSVLNSES